MNRSPEKKNKNRTSSGRVPWHHEYDESSNSTFYGIYEPVKDDNGAVVGILKGVLDAYDVRVIGNQLEDL